jgi:IclR family pca regulon transcriptional regulator
VAKTPASRSRREFVASLDRGLRVLQAFSREHAELTLSEVAALTNLSPATARRSLQTLETLGYVGRLGRQFLLRPKVLALGSGYLRAINASVVLQPFLQDVVNDVGGSASVTVLDGPDIVFLARASASRTVRVTAAVGARYPAYATAMGRVLLAYRPERALDAYFAGAAFEKLTDATETSPRKLRQILKQIRVRGYASSQGELEYGIVAAALPIFGPHRRVVAAAGCSDVTTRLDAETMVARRLPALRRAVQRIESMLVQHPELERSVESVTAEYIPRALARVRAARRRAASRRR